MRSREFADVLDAGAVRAVFQPLIEVASGQIVGYEALTRGPEATSLERPDALFAAARDAGRVAELAGRAVPRRSRARSRAASRHRSRSS